MKTTLFRTISFSLLAGLVIISGCEKERLELTNNESKDISEEALIDSYYQDLDDLASVAINAPSDQEYSGGRSSATITIEDSRFSCQGIVVNIDPTGTPDHPQGTITVDFGTTGCSDLRGNVRKGKLIFTYDGARFQPNSTLITTTDNYYINDIKLEGVRTSTNITGSTQQAPKFNVVLENGKATFADGTTALRESDITVSWIRGENPTLDKLLVHTGSIAAGTTRSGTDYNVSLTEQLEYQRFCAMAVSGIKNYIVNGTKNIIIDYGAGSCDKTITVTINGVTRTITIG